jgi:hypothetical protein
LTRRQIPAIRLWRKNKVVHRQIFKQIQFAPPNTLLI